MSYVGIPFVKKGWTREGAHCWGLVRLVYEDEGVILPEYGEISSEELIAIARAVRRDSAMDPWMIAEKPYRRLDVVLMRNFKPGHEPIHIGVLLDHRRMLHTTPEADAHIVPFGTGVIPYRILAVHRHRRFA
jgi:cell wall-associated NlpC family hydrolase